MAETLDINLPGCKYCCPRVAALADNSWCSCVCISYVQGGERLHFIKKRLGPPSLKGHNDRLTLKKHHPLLLEFGTSGTHRVLQQWRRCRESLSSWTTTSGAAVLQTCEDTLTGKTGQVGTGACSNVSKVHPFVELGCR